MDRASQGTRHTPTPTPPMIAGPSLPAPLMQVPHLVEVETDQMYYARKMREFQEASIKPPIFVKHTMPQQ